MFCLLPEFLEYTYLRLALGELANGLKGLVDCADTVASFIWPWRDLNREMRDFMLMPLRGSSFGVSRASLHLLVSMVSGLDLSCSHS